ncbi:MAG TPA: PEGA domain-containing protein [bacterium]|nr:PEGA domain-containing protein [bacterium]
MPSKKTQTKERGLPSEMLERGDALSPNDKTIIKSADDPDELTPSRPQYSPPYLVIIDGPRAGAHFPLGPGENVIGRAPGNAVRLEDQSVSRQHAEISKGTSGWLVKDLGSKNGTSVNGRSATEAVIIGHKDLIKTGIYLMRLVTQPLSQEDEMELPRDAMAERTVFVSAPPDGQTARMDDLSDAVPGDSVAGGEDQGLPDDFDEYEEQELIARKASAMLRRKKRVMYGGLILALLLAAGYFGYRTILKRSVSAVKTQQVPSQPADLSQTPPPGSDLPPAAGEGTGNLPPSGPVQPGSAIPSAAPEVAKVPVFLDIASSPMPVNVTFQGQPLGRTPLRVNIELEPDSTHEIEALFEMPEIGENFTQKMEFTTEKGQSVIPILFRGPIGMLKINDIPRDVEFYLEGKFSYDKFQDRSAKITEVVLEKPIYVPYGKYFMELRRERQLGQSSQTFVTDIIFRRDFTIGEESPTFVLGVKDADLAVFPARVRSEPENADVYIDGKKVGKTPFEGVFPIGEHRLSVRKEGFFEHSEGLKVDINTPYVANIKLQTSLAGAHLNNAKLAMDRQMWQDAINELAEALNKNAAPSEVAQAHYMLGLCYANLNDIQRAMGYFEQAREHPDQRHRAMLGLVNGYAAMDKLDAALPLLVEVMLKVDDEGVKREANDMFQKISPFRSVIYVYSEPPGASVTVNGKPVAQPTPVILHELPLGNYKIRVEKPGYLPTDLNLSMSVNEFNPVIVNLKPIPR